MRRRKYTKRASPRRSFFKMKSKRSRKGSNSVKMLQIDAMAYGAVRGLLSNWISPLTSKIPLGDMADEVGCGLVDYFVAKNTSGMIKNIATKGLIIENAFVGSALASKMMTATSSTNANNSIYNY